MFIAPINLVNSNTNYQKNNSLPQFSGYKRNAGDLSKTYKTIRNVRSQADTFDKKIQSATNKLKKLLKKQKSQSTNPTIVEEIHIIQSELRALKTEKF